MASTKIHQQTDENLTGGHSFTYEGGRQAKAYAMRTRGKVVDKSILRAFYDIFICNVLLSYFVGFGDVYLPLKCFKPRFHITF